MASYHLSVKVVSRGKGRSAVAAAAYRAGERIHDERLGETCDYTGRDGVLHTEIVSPLESPEWADDRSRLWNAAEAAEGRINSTVAREVEVALPVELSPEDRETLAREFARDLCERHGCAVDLAIHAPGKGDQRNHHAHLLLTTRRLGPEGFTEKTRELDRNGAQVEKMRARWAERTNDRLRFRGLSARVDHRSHADRGIEAEPDRHLGPKAAAMERKNRLADRARAVDVADRQPAVDLERMSDADLARARRDHQAEVGRADPVRDKLEEGLAGCERREARAEHFVGEQRKEIELYRETHTARAWLHDQVGVGGGKLRKLDRELERREKRLARLSADRERAEDRLVEYAATREAGIREARGPELSREQARECEQDIRQLRRRRELVQVLEKERDRGLDRGQDQDHGLEL